MSAGQAVLIPDGESVLAMSVVQCLSAAGFAPHLLCDSERGRTRFSRHVLSIKVAPAGKTADEEFARVRQALEACGADVCLPVAMDAFYFCAKFRKELSEVCALPPLPDAATIDVFGDKGKTAEFCRAHGISHPESRCFPTEAELRAAAHSLPYPILLKPKTGTGSAGIQRIDSTAELWQKLQGRRAADFVFQQFVAGYDIDASVLCVDGKILSTAIQRRPQTKGPPPFGVIEFLEHAPTHALASQVVSAANYSGVAHLDCRVDERTGEPYLLEVNPRFWGSLSAADVAGANFAAGMARLALGQAAAIPAQVDPCLFVAVRNLPAFLPSWLFGADPAFARRSFRTDLRFFARDPRPFIKGALSRWRAEPPSPPLHGREAWEEGSAASANSPAPARPRPTPTSERHSESAPGRWESRAWS